jgi:tetratricopeptide (TPR) repeat protein
LLIFLITLNQWISFESLLAVARASGWNWQPEFVQPVTMLVFWPFRLLPAAWIPLALNIFTACCAALALALLARSVGLLRRDSRYHNRDRVARLAWIPPVLAVLVCGLQLSFWQQATSVTGDMIDLLIFAYVIRCLLEFRADRKESWLTRGAFLYAAGMCNNWALMVYFPIFLVALIRLKGLEILNVRFLLRLGFWGLAGLSFYLLLPLVNSLSSVHHMSFWPTLKANLRFQKQSLNAFRHSGLLPLALTTFLPLLVISFRWKSGYNNPSGRVFTQAIVHFAHAVFLCASLWLILDPPFSPRNRGNIAAPLAQYYIFAFVAGYCAGYFLSLASRSLGSARGRRSRSGRHKHRREIQTYLAYGSVAAVCLALAAIPSILIIRNLPQIRASNGSALREYIRQLYQALPTGRSVALSNDPGEVFLLQGELAARGQEKEVIPLDTQALHSSQYQLFMARKFKARWPLVSATTGIATIRPMNPLGLLYGLSVHEALAHLHPSFDFCYELFRDEPHAPVHFLVARATNETGAATLDAGIAATNEHYWQQRWTDSLQGLAASSTAQPPKWAARLFEFLRLKPEQNRTSLFLGKSYSRCLDYWGVQMQRLGHWKEAGIWFERALELNPANLSAQINLEYNQRHQRGDAARLADQGVDEISSKYRNWATAVQDNGPVDEPSLLWLTAFVLWFDGNYHQAAEGFARCAELAPDWLPPKFGLAESYLRLGDFASAMRLAESVPVSSAADDEMAQAKVVSLRARALGGLGRKKEAETCIVEFASRHETDMLAKAARLYIQQGQYEPALTLLDQLLTREPDNPEFLSNKGWTEIMTERYDAAIGTLTKAVALAPTNDMVWINRATAYLRAGQLDAAHADYEQLLERSPNSIEGLCGLAAVALGKQDTNAAIGLYRRVLATRTPQSAEYKLVFDRLQRLQGK